MKTINLSPSPERGTWDFAPEGWQQLFGSYRREGVSVEWHDFEAPHTIAWDRSFHSDSLEICLNVAGGAGVRAGASNRIAFSDRTTGFYSSRGERLKAFRQKGDQHRFVTVEVSRSYLDEVLHGRTTGLHPLAKAFVSSRDRFSSCARTKPLNSSLQHLVLELQHPPVPPAARPVWFHCKVVEVISQTLFEEHDTQEFFCTRQKRLARERVENLKLLLKQNLAEPLSLQAVSQAIGCSPFYLSRIFSQETGATISRYLQRLRMERAAELLRAGAHNVTEAAVEVGYSSLSHFTKAFHGTFGCCPGLYPIRGR